MEFPWFLWDVCFRVWNPTCFTHLIHVVWSWMLALNVNTMISNFTDLLMILLVTWVCVDAPITNRHASNLCLQEAAIANCHADNLCCHELYFVFPQQFGKVFIESLHECLGNPVDLSIIFHCNSVSLLCRLCCSLLCSNLEVWTQVLKTMGR
jgi:hypothetical protein